MRRNSQCCPGDNDHVINTKKKQQRQQTFHPVSVCLCARTGKQAPGAVSSFERRLRSKRIQQ